MCSGNKTGAACTIASNGGILPKRGDANTVVRQPKFHQDSEGNDENAGDLMQRPQKMMPAAYQTRIQNG